jgi:adenylate cyclase
VVAVAASWMFGRQVDNYTYDYMFQRMPPKAGPPQSVILAIDDATLRDAGGMGHIRGALAAGLRRIAAAKPKVIAVDIILADSVDPPEDAQLADAFRVTPNLVLDCEMDPAGTQWEDPLPAFLQSAPALGQVYADPDPGDSVTRAIPLEKVDTHHHRRWALSLEAFRVSRGVPRLVESPTDLQVADTIIPIVGAGTGHIRSMRVRYLPADTIPRVSLKRVRELDDSAIASLFTGKAVFVGVTAMTEVRDRLFTPLANGQTPGIMIHAARAVPHGR